MNDLYVSAATERDQLAHELARIRSRAGISLRMEYRAYLALGDRALRDNCREITFIMTGAYPSPYRFAREAAA